MKAMILAAGLGTRLKPWTTAHPKALVPVGGVPMLERVISRLRREGFDDMVVNVHHFSDQIKEFLRSRDFGVKISISDESDLLLDTGGGILHARDLLFVDDEPVLIHNVDILSNACLADLMSRHKTTGAEATLLVSNRNSSRRLIADKHGRLKGWHNLQTREYKPSDYQAEPTDREYAFSGIHVVSRNLVERMEREGRKGAFPIMDVYLSNCRATDYHLEVADNLELIDIGKPETLQAAQTSPLISK